MHLVLLVEDRREEAKSLDVVEVEVRQAQVDRAAAGCAGGAQPAEAANPGPASRMILVPSSHSTSTHDVLPP